MNREQQLAYGDIFSGQNIFITGGGGVGKTYFIKYVYNEFSKLRNILLTSTTGTSAILIKGKTVHSALGIGRGDGTVEQLLKRIKSGKSKMNWKRMDMLIIDEISMLNPDLFDKLEEIARLIKKNDKPFGGIRLLLSGDFCHTL